MWKNFSFPLKLGILIGVGLLINLAAVSYICFHLFTKGQLPKEISRLVPEDLKKLVPDDKVFWAETEKIADRAIHADPKDPTGYSQRAYARWYLGEREGAYSDYTRAIKLDPDNSEYYERRGELKFQEKKYDLALSDFNSAMQYRPHEFRYLLQRAKVYGATGKLDLALADFDLSIASGEHVQYAHVEKGVLLQLAKHYADAVGEYEKGLQFEDSDSKEKALKGFFQVAVLNGEFNRAISGLEKYAKEHPNKSYAYLRIADLYGALGQKDKRQNALLDASKALSSELFDTPFNAELFEKRAKAYKELEGYEREFKDDCDQAVRLYKEAAAEKPSDYWEDVAGVYEMSGDTAMLKHTCKIEISRLDALISKNPKDGDAYHSRAEAFEEMKDYSSALRDYKIGEKYFCDCNSYFYHMGEMYLAQRAFDDSIENFETEIRRGRPEFADFVGISAAYEGIGDYDKAIANAQKGVKLKELNSRVYYWLGKAQKGKGLILEGDLNIKRAIALGFAIPRNQSQN